MTEDEEVEKAAKDQLLQLFRIASDPEVVKAMADQAYKLMTAYMYAGFSRDEAIKIICASLNKKYES